MWGWCLPLALGRSWPERVGIWLPPESSVYAPPMHACQLQIGTCTQRSHAGRAWQGGDLRAACPQRPSCMLRSIACLPWGLGAQSGVMPAAKLPPDENSPWGHALQPLPP